MLYYILFMTLVRYAPYKKLVAKGDHLFCFKLILGEIKNSTRQIKKVLTIPPSNCTKQRFRLLALNVHTETNGTAYFVM